MPQLITGAGVYDYPQYWDLAFRDETKAEARFLVEAADRWTDRPLSRVYEPGCGGGRLVVELAAQGIDVVACDNNRACVRYVRQRLRRRELDGIVELADMCQFAPEKPVDVAVCPVNTIRHLLTENDVQNHLTAVARAVRPGGLYVIGLHLMPPDADEEDGERWTARHGKTKVTVTLKVADFSRRTRRETLKFSLRVRSGSRDLRLVSEFEYRLYDAAQMKRTIAAASDWTLLSIHDFWYDIDDPLPLDDDRADTVLVLQRNA